MINSPKSIALAMLSSSDIKHISACEIITDYLPKSPMDYSKKSLYDERMGPSFFQHRCKTCGESISKCTGHIGFIELIIPLLNPVFQV